MSYAKTVPDIRIIELIYQSGADIVSAFSFAFTKSSQKSPYFRPLVTYNPLYYSPWTAILLK